MAVSSLLQAEDLNIEPTQEAQVDEEFTFDFSKVGIAVPDQAYVVVIRSASPGKNKDDSPMILLGCEIEEPEDYAGVAFYTRLNITGQSLGRTKRAITAIFGEAIEKVSRSAFVDRRVVVMLTTNASADGSEMYINVAKWVRPVA